MSYIDVLEHEHVGFFAGLPVYRPLENYTPEATVNGEFSCATDNLVLGGGYLEHPGMVVRDLNFVAAVFIIDWINYCDEYKCSIYSDEDTDEWMDVAHNYVFGKDEFNLLDCVHWSMRDYSDFYESCRSSALRAPFVETERRNEFEHWLASNFGELVVFSYPELITDSLLGEIAKKVDRYLYGNIQILPAGFPNDYLGRRCVNGEAIQGVRAWSVGKRVIGAS